MNWYLKALKQYVDFNGRARRKEYWIFMLMYVIISFVLEWGISAAFGVTTATVVVGLYALALFLPSLGVTIRRMHDVGKSGWMILIFLIPIIGWIWYFILMVSDGQAGDNEYGPDPKAEVGTQS